MNSDFHKIFSALYLLGDEVKFEKLTNILNLDKDTIINLCNENASVLNALNLNVVYNHDSISLRLKVEDENILKAIKEIELSSPLTPAALQVLTIVAYLNGATRSEVSYIRGVASGISIRALTTRGLIIREGEKLYLSNEALAHLGISKLEELPDYENIQNDFKNKLNESLNEE